MFFLPVIILTGQYHHGVYCMSGKKAGEAKRQQIMKAAENLFASRRYHELTLDMVAKQAKVGKGTIYRYFKDKDDLFLQTGRWAFEQLCDSLLKVKVTQRGLKKALQGACLRLGEFYHQRWQLMQMMKEEERRKVFARRKMWEGWMKAKIRLIDILTGIIASGGGKELRRDITPRVMAALLLQMVEAHSPVLWEMERKKRYKLVIEMFCHGAAGK